MAKQTVKYPEVMLIDDNEIDNYINERIIVSNDFCQHVIVKDSCSEALAYLEKNEYYPDIIFLDLNMPVMNGFAFLEHFEKIAAKKPLLKEKTKIIVLSSSINPDDIDRASVNPFVYKYLNKPLSPDYLNAINY